MLRVTVLQPGSFFGEVAIIRTTPRIASCRALTPCDLFSLNRDDFENIMELFPSVRETVLEVANARMQVTNNLQRKAALKRVVNVARSSIRMSMLGMQRRQSQLLEAPTDVAPLTEDEQAEEAALVEAEAGDEGEGPELEQQQQLRRGDEELVTDVRELEDLIESEWAAAPVGVVDDAAAADGER